MREFVMVDLTTQMPYLPRGMQTWPRERVLAWLRVWGEVWKIDSIGRYATPDRYTFRSWCGRWTFFELTEDGQMFIPGTTVKAWADGEWFRLRRETWPRRVLMEPNEGLASLPAE